EPAATLDFCRNSADETWPSEILVSAVITWIGEVDSYSVRRSSEPVTVIRSSSVVLRWLSDCAVVVCAASCSAVLAGSCANTVVVYRQAVTAATSGRRLRLCRFVDITTPPSG